MKAVPSVADEYFITVVEFLCFSKSHNDPSIQQTNETA